MMNLEKSIKDLPAFKKFKVSFRKSRRNSQRVLLGKIMSILGSLIWSLSNRMGKGSLIG